MQKLWRLTCIVTGLGMMPLLAGCGGGGERDVTAAQDGAGLGAAIVGMWQAVSATVDGQAVAVAEARGHDSSVDRVIVRIRTDDSLTEYAYAGPDLLVRQTGTWAVSGSTLTVSWPDHTEAFDCTISGDYLTTKCGNDDCLIALVWARISLVTRLPRYADDLS